MSSGITTTPIIPAPEGCPLSVEYTLELSDHVALDMFVFDTVIRKSWRFRIKYHATYMLIGVVLGAIVGVLVWGSMIIWNPSVEPFRPRFAGCLGALGMFTIVLIGLLPGSSLHKVDRSAQEKRFREVRHAQRRASILRYPQRYRVILTPEWFTETIEFHETGIAVEITEHKETRVWWVAVTSIAVASDHAFFHVKDKGYLILPRAAFADEVSFRIFVDMARSYREEARAMPAPRLELPAPQDTRITR